ncbi:hypothetical protein ABKV19_001515 [Rosa sericea]
MLHLNAQSQPDSFLIEIDLLKPSLHHLITTMKSILISFVTIFISFQLLLAAPNPPQAPPPAPTPPPDSFILVIVWPNTFCLFESCKLHPQSFTLHGLWPQANGKSLVDCAGSEMDESTLNGKKDDLNKYWPDLKHSKFEESKSFWIHEWEKHGRCSAKSPANYLSLVFDLMKKHDVEQIFKNNGILPSKNGYPMTQLGQAIFHDTKLWTRIKCQSNDRHQFLFQIYFCLTAQGQFRNCSKTGADYTGCTKKPPVTFPLPPPSLIVKSKK